MIITATTRETAAPPAVTLEVTAIPAGAATWGITRAVSGVPTTPVRGAEKVLLLGVAGGVTDYEAPFGVNATYLATAYDTAGAPVASAQTQVVLDVDVMWITDPLAPSLAAACRGVKSPETFASITYSLNTAVTPTEGVELPVGLSGVRQAASAVPLVIIAGTAAEAQPIRAVLRYASPFLLRCPIRWQVPLPPLAYCLANSVSETLFGGMYGRSHLSTTFDLVQPPTRAIAVNLRTYGTLLQEATTYGDLTGLYDTYLHVLLGGG